jgi:hypothetical protein
MTCEPNPAPRRAAGGGPYSGAPLLASNRANDPDADAALPAREAWVQCCHGRQSGRSQGCATTNRRVVRVGCPGAPRGWHCRPLGGRHSRHSIRRGSTPKHCRASRRDQTGSVGMSQEALSCHAKPRWGPDHRRPIYDHRRPIYTSRRHRRRRRCSCHRFRRRPRPRSTIVSQLRGNGRPEMKRSDRAGAAGIFPFGFAC